MRIRVQGGQPLNGDYQPSGNSNAAVALLAASLLTDQTTVLKNLPRTTSTQIMIDIASWLGASLEWKDRNTLSLKVPQLAKRSLTPTETHSFVGALLFIAPILKRRGYVHMEVDFPLNRIRTHLDALRDLGQDVITKNGALEIKAVEWEFKDIMLTQSSVTATEICLMLAATMGGETVIRNAASEPHVQQLADALELMGAQIEGVGSNVLRVFGGRDLVGTTLKIRPNHVEIASIAALVALTGGRVKIEGTEANDLLMVSRVYQSLGITLDMDESVLFVPKHNDLSISNREEDVDSSIKAAPWPGFPSDLISIATVVATQARGTSLIHEPMFDNRLLFIDKLNAMGAQIVLCDPHRAIVVGPTQLRAIYMDTPDIRIGLGLLAAAMIAQGESVIDNAQAINNSFDDVLEKLIRLGAHIKLD